MRYQKSERIQNEDYSSISEFLNDVIETLIDESNYEQTVNIIADTELTEMLIKEFYSNNVEDFKFNLQIVDYTQKDNTITEFKITILSDGEVFIEPAMDKNGEYYDCDGFIFLQNEITDKILKGNNRRCDAIVFEINN
jgi:hypothetical protein